MANGTAQCICPRADKCPSVARPICGDDGKTYPNSCLLEAQSCQMKKRVEVKDKKRCSEYCMTSRKTGWKISVEHVVVAQSHHYLALSSLSFFSWSLFQIFRISIFKCSLRHVTQELSQVFSEFIGLVIIEIYIFFSSTV